jgi:hypothetical protein
MGLDEGLENPYRSLFNTHRSYNLEGNQYSSQEMMLEE